MRVADRGEELVFGVGIEVGEGHRRTRLGNGSAEEAVDELRGLAARLREVGAPGNATIRPVHASDERRDDLAQLLEHHRRVRLCLGQRVRPHTEQQRLERLAAAVDADVRQRRGGQDAAGGVARLWPDALLVGEIGVGRVLRVTLPGPVEQLREHAGIGVEQPVEVGDVAPSEGRVGEHGAVAVVPVAAAELAVVRDVAGGLLHVRHHATPLEDLREDVGCLLAREVHSPELRDGVVAVLEEDPFVERLGPLQADGGVDGEIAGEVEVGDELVEEEATQALRAPRVTREQGALDHLGEVDHAVHGTIEVGEIPAEDGFLVVGELLHGVHAQCFRLRRHGSAMVSVGHPLSVDLLFPLFAAAPQGLRPRA